MKRWKQVKFKDILENNSISYGIVQPGSHQNINSVPILRVNNLSQNRIDLSNVLQVAKEIEENYLRTRLEGGELLITVVGSVGICVVATKELKGWNVARAIAVGKIKNDYDINFIKYQFYSDDIKFQIYGNINDTVQPTLNLSSLKELSFFVPPLREQRAIAAVLSNLDDKIDLLQRQNATLEAMAEALFKQWFVVEAKEGWKEKPLSGVASFLNGLACQKYRPANFVERLPVLKIRELSNGISQDSEWASSTVPKEYIVKFGDVIFSWSGSLMVKIWDGEDCVLNQHLFKVTSHEYPKWFYYFWCKQHLQEFISISESKATTMGHIKRGDLDAAMVKVPKRSEIEAMSNIITPYLSKLEENKAQIRTLEKLRDTLLPKLMSGEVRVALD